MNVKPALQKRRWIGLTLVELLVIIAILAVLIGMLLPSLVRPPRHAHRIKCVNNLKNVGLAFRIFAVDNEDRFPMQISTNEGGSLEFLNSGLAFYHFRALSNELSTPNLLTCPNDTRRKPATNFVSLREADLSYFVGLDAGAAFTNAFLAGDRNLTVNGRAASPGLVHLTTNAAVGWTKEIHNLQGNVALADGSVQQFSGPRLNQALRRSGIVTNRLAVP